MKSRRSYDIMESNNNGWCDKKMQKYYNRKKHTPKCEYCIYAKIPADRSVALCKFDVVVSLENKCRRYDYDPLKRVPDKLRINKDYTEDDFKL